MTSVQPLDGVTVIDFSQVELGPCATQTLADHGAEVIKVERPGTGELHRWSLGEDAGPDNAVFSSLNRNKRSITVDFRSDEGNQVIRDLVADADVLVHNFRPGAMERKGLGYDDLREVNPRLIYAVGSGFGPTGPYAHKGGQDVLAQALTGAMARKADPNHPLAIYATAIGDYAAGMHLVQGILLALRARDNTGQGQRVDASLFNSMLAMQMQEATVQLMEDWELNWAAMPLSGVFETKDGAVVLIGAFKPNPLRDICAALGIEDLSTEERFATLERQREHRDELQTTFRDRFASDTTARWIERLEGQDLLCSPVQTLAEALDDPQTRHNEMVVTIERDGLPPVETVGSPITLSDTPARVPVRPPHIGEHTDQVLAEHGYTPERIAALRESEVVA